MARPVRVTAPTRPSWRRQEWVGAQVEMEASGVPVPATKRFGLPVPIGRLADENLARLAGQGNERAFTALYERYHQPIYRYCRMILRHDADAQDALQAVFASAFVALREKRRDAPLRAWLYRIARNESVSSIRLRRSAGELPDQLEAPASEPLEVMDRQERLEQLFGDLRRLPERQRSALVMRELGGLSHDEIAAAMRVTVATTKQAIFEARRSLSDFAEGRAMACVEICRLASDGDGRLLRSRKVRSHLHDCPDCAAFAASVRTRSRDLRTLVPCLPAATASVLLTRALGAGGAAKAGVGAAGLGGAGSAGSATASGAGSAGSAVAGGAESAGVTGAGSAGAAGLGGAAKAGVLAVGSTKLAVGAAVVATVAAGGVKALGPHARASRAASQSVLAHPAATGSTVRTAASAPAGGKAGAHNGRSTAAGSTGMARGRAAAWRAQPARDQATATSPTSPASSTYPTTTATAATPPPAPGTASGASSSTAPPATTTTSGGSTTTTP